MTNHEAWIESARKLASDLSAFRFSAPVAYTYNPLVYAWEPHRIYLDRFGTGPKRALFLGMNPGPFGMAQTGIPFGEIASVRDWMGIEAPVSKPDPEHPKRPIDGFACTRSEVSGRRLWGLFSETFPKARDFFADHFVLNFCPLVWMKDTGANLTPDKLPASEMAPVDELCRAYLAESIRHLRPSFMVGVGTFAEEKLRQAAEASGSKASISRVLHPSPASPAANRGWAEAAVRQLKQADIW